MLQQLLKLVLLLAFVGSMANSQQNKTTELTEGMKVYKKKMRKGCRSTGLRFSRAHTKHQWEIIKNHGLLRREAKSLCPHLDTSLLSDNDWDKVYTFLSDYSSDNKITPSC